MNDAIEHVTEIKWFYIHIELFISIGRQSTISITQQGKKLMPDIRQAWEVLYRLYSDALGEDAARDLNRSVVAFNQID